MAVKRIWFPNIPSSGLDSADRSQIGVHVPLDFVFLNQDSYLRRYLGDPIDLIIGTAIAETVRSATGDETYLRRYLDDPI